jgi:hypothetical protein
LINRKNSRVGVQRLPVRYRRYIRATGRRTVHMFIRNLFTIPRKRRIHAICMCNSYEAMKPPERNSSTIEFVSDGRREDPFTPPQLSESWSLSMVGHFTILRGRECSAAPGRYGSATSVSGPFGCGSIVLLKASN